MNQPTDINLFVIEQGEAVIVLDFDSFAKDMTAEKLVYLNGQIARELLDREINGGNES
jgi:hypothetical protein